MSTNGAHPASRALAAILQMLADAGIQATRDAGAFYPQPIGTLVGLPALVGRGLAGRTFEVSVRVVSGDPLNTSLAVDRLYALADDVAFALRAAEYEPADWSRGPNAEPLPAVLVTATLTVPEEET